MIQKLRVWDTVKKSMSEVQAIVYAEERVYPIYSKVVRRYIPFSEAILMQSTGLFDSSEPPKEIFEGDIIRLEVPNQSMCGTYEVRRANSGEWRIDNRTQGRRLYDSLNNITVIGNIHQHPHLLEEK